MSSRKSELGGIGFFLLKMCRHSDNSLFKQSAISSTGSVNGKTPPT